MLDGNQEQERLKRLREQQLRARDPDTKQRQHQRMTAQRERKRDKSYSLGRMWRDIPHLWRYSIFGFVLGILVLLILPLLWDSPSAQLCSFAAILVFTIFGGMLGNAIDVRENIKDLTR